MCGIWTFVGVDREGGSLPVPHRGPDDHGVARFTTPAGALTMENYRLAIQDVSPAGHQPMSYGGGRYTVVFNGEIYNYVELAAELEERGHRFQSRCDTEVLLAAYAEWEEGCLGRFDGMFAFCIYDARDQRLFAARDRFGIKPLYYHNTPEGLAMASEIKQLTGLSHWRPQLNVGRAVEFLSYGFLDHTVETLFADVCQLRGGECVALSLGTWRPGQPLSVRRWYQVPAVRAFRGSFDDAAAEYQRLFRDSIRLRLRADVAVGSCLSGGMDSSAIVGVVNRLLREAGHVPDQRTFSSCSHIEAYDERQYIDEVTRFTGTRGHHVFPEGAEFFDRLNDLVYAQDEPFDSTSIYAQWSVFREAKRQGVKVMLDGQGGDEQLQSYPQFFGVLVGRLIRRLQLISALKQAVRLGRYHAWLKRRTLQSLAASWASPGLYRGLLQVAGKAAIPAWLNRPSLRQAGLDDPVPWRLLYDMSGQLDASNLSRLMLDVTPLPMLLHWEDRSSMAHSVEARVPFLDHRLLEFTLSLPDEFKTRDGVTKLVLRAANSDAVPEKVRKRTDKMGFVTPEAVWMKEQHADRVREGLRQTAMVFPGLIDGPGLERHGEDVLAGRVPFGSSLCRALTFGAWGRVFRLSS